MPLSPNVPPSAENDLEEFRAEWRREVAHRKNDALPSVSSLSLRDDPPAAPKRPPAPDHESLSGDDGAPASPEQVQSPQSALEYYVQAVEQEQRGQLGQALANYRHAFRMKDNVDQEYKKLLLTDAKAVHPSLPGAAPSSSGNTDVFRHTVPIAAEYEHDKDAKWHDPLESLVDAFSSEDTTMQPRVDYKPVHLNKLPNEMIATVMKHSMLMSLASFPQLAVVCKRMFLLTRSASIWRYLCEQTYRPPSLTLGASRRLQEKYVEEHYGGHWLRMFIERPRIRYDGVYISTCHYVRPGTSESAWNQPVHLVTYYRYLRFFPDGLVIQHVHTAEPHTVVRQLSRHFNKRQTFHGRYRWCKNDDGELFLQIESQDNTVAHERFFMTLMVKGTHRGRHNKLVWRRYASINERQIDDQDDPRRLFEEYMDGIVNNDSSGFDLEHVYDLKTMKPFFFSPVRSYRVAYPADDDA
ncbi:hypothetical protein BC940DRAFT_332050 [Gongronella butleri]|nr:hypothetical protein BC940DRAFT_332050 [Gongronella butleri]